MRLDIFIEKSYNFFILFSLFPVKKKDQKAAINFTNGIYLEIERQPLFPGQLWGVRTNGVFKEIILLKTICKNSWDEPFTQCFYSKCDDRILNIVRQEGRISSVLFKQGG